MLMPMHRRTAMKVKNGRVLKKNNHASRGEPYAEAYANSVLERVFPSYARAFDL
jgi:hypothetical protein